MLTGGFSIPTVYCIGYRTMARPRVGLVYFGEATRHSEGRVGRVRTLIRREQVRHSDAFVAACQDARDYFEDLGADPSRVWISLLTTDVAAFERPDLETSERVRELRAKLNFRDKIILYCGRLTRQKGVDLLLHAFQRVQAHLANVSLVIVGSGEQEAELKSTVRTLALSNVHFAGFVQQRDLPSWYHLADLFVFPTLCDRFGVVIVEAIAAGLPVVCSKFAGAARDLVVDGKNGFVVDPEEVDT